MGTATGLIRGDDGIMRCHWAAGSDDYRAYHDIEWGVEVRGETELFERMTLEAFQSGLSWITILRKRDAFRHAFAGFDPNQVARFDDHDIARLMNDSGIVRNRRKIEAAITNAQAVIDLRADGGLSAFLWSFAPEQSAAPASLADVVATSAESIAMSRALKQRGFVFVGPTTMYALMCAVGMVDGHIVGCHRHFGRHPSGETRVG